ncbi:MAG: hypothetical protein ACP5KN_01040 [Armatimonadota bacterium]
MRESPEETGNEERDEKVVGEIRGEEPQTEPRPEAPRPGRRPIRGRSVAIGCLLAILGALVGGGVAYVVSQRGADEPDQAPAGELPPVEGEVENRVLFSPTPRRPEHTPDIIPSETGEIFCFYELVGAPADAEVVARWWHEGAPLGGLPLRDHQRTEGSDGAAGRFTIIPPASVQERGETDGETGQAAFPPGIYEVEVTSAGDPHASARGSFVALPQAAKILAGGGEPEGPPVIRSLRLAADVSDDGSPIRPASEFGPDVGRIHAVFRYAGVVSGSVFIVRWYCEGTELEDARTELAVTAAEGWTNAWLDVQDGELPEGRYRVAVHLGEEPEPLASVGFTVTSASEEERPPERRSEDVAD